MKIAIYSGSIPSSPFIEKLISGVATTHEVYLFGTKKTTITYQSKHIHVIPTPTHLWYNVLLTFKRLIQLSFKQPKLIPIAYIEAKRYPTCYERYMRFSRFLPVLLHQPDIFHLQWAATVDRWLFLKKAYGCKIIVSLRGAHINYSPIANPQLAEHYRRCFPQVDQFHAVSEAIGIEAQQYHAEPSKIRVIHTLIEATTFMKFRTYKKPDPKQRLKLCCVGRFHWKKGYSYVLKACAILKTMAMDFELTIIASNTVTEDILYLVHDLNLTKEVSILKGMPQESLFQFMQTFDVLILPSVEEGIANVVLEAMALGIPVISTNCGGMPEVVIPGETGWLVQVRDPEAIAHAVVEVSKTPEIELQRITQNAHDFVKEHFNAEDSIAKFLDLYEGVMRTGDRMTDERRN